MQYRKAASLTGEHSNEVPQGMPRGERSEFRAPDLNFKFFNRCPVWAEASCIISRYTWPAKQIFLVFPYLKSCKSDYLNVCQKLSKFKWYMLQQGKAVFVHKTRGSIQKLRRGKNPYAEMHHFLREMWVTAEKLWAVFEIFLWFCRVEWRPTARVQWCDCVCLRGCAGELWDLRQCRTYKL